MAMTKYCADVNCSDLLVAIKILARQTAEALFYLPKCAGFVTVNANVTGVDMLALKI